MKAYSLYTAGIALLFCARLQSQTTFSPVVEQLADEYVEHRANHGLAIAIIKDGQLITKGFGELSKKDKRTPDDNTIFEVGGITTVFTTSMMALQANNGTSYAIEDPVQAYLPDGVQLASYQAVYCTDEYQTRMNEFGHPVAEPVCYSRPLELSDHISFCDLATHTSALPNTPQGLYSWNPFRLGKQRQNPFKDYSKTALYAGLDNYLLGYAPGTFFHYSNLGMAILGNVVADISEGTYEEVLQKVLLQPLALADTHVQLPEAKLGQLAPGHNRRGKSTPHWTFVALAPAGGLKSTITDMGHFVQHNLVQKEDAWSTTFATVHQARVDVRPLYGRPSSIGYGWFTSQLSTASNLPVTWVNGTTGGFRAFIGFTKDTGIGVVLLSNSAQSVDELGFAILTQLNDAHLAKE